MQSKGEPQRPVTMTVPEGGQHFYGYGPSASYRAAKRGDLVVVRLGKKALRVLVAATERKLEEAGRQSGGTSAAA